MPAVAQERVAAFKAAAAAAGAVGGGVFVGHSAQLKQLQEQNKRLTEENQRLQNKILRVDQEPVRVQELEDNYNKLLEVRSRPPTHWPRQPQEQEARTLWHLPCKVGLLAALHFISLCTGEHAAAEQGGQAELGGSPEQRGRQRAGGGAAGGER